MFIHKKSKSSSRKAAVVKHKLPVADIKEPVKEMTKKSMVNNKKEKQVEQSILEGELKAGKNKRVDKVVNETKNEE